MATSNLGAFINSASSKLGVLSLGRKKDLPALDEILNSGRDRAVLRLLREETALIVVKIRLLNEERQAEIAALMDEYAEEEALIEAQGLAEASREEGLFDGIQD